jgi:hypothetical protein
MDNLNDQLPEGQSEKDEVPLEQIPRCLFCGSFENLIWVHGHGQCAYCGINAMPCCDGGVCGTD